LVRLRLGGSRANVRACATLISSESWNSPILVDKQLGSSKVVGLRASSRRGDQDFLPSKKVIERLRGDLANVLAAET